MGFIRDRFGNITIESRSESFYIHPSYGYESGGAADAELGSFGAQWRSNPHPEFLVADLDGPHRRQSLNDVRPEQMCPYCLRDVSTYQGLPAWS